MHRRAFTIVFLIIAVQYPESVNALLLQAMLCVSHNGTIADPILTGFGGCFEMLKNFGFNISGSAFFVAA